MYSLSLLFIRIHPFPLFLGVQYPPKFIEAGKCQFSLYFRLLHHSDDLLRVALFIPVNTHNIVFQSSHPHKKYRRILPVGMLQICYIFGNLGFSDHKARNFSEKKRIPDRQEYQKKAIAIFIALFSNGEDRISASCRRMPEAVDDN